MYEVNLCSTASLELVVELMQDGHWTDAQELFSGINVTPRDFSDWLEYQELEVIKDFGLLGFYTRDYSPIEGGNYDR